MSCPSVVHERYTDVYITHDITLVITGRRASGVGFRSSSYPQSIYEHLVGADEIVHTVIEITDQRHDKDREDEAAPA